MSTRSEILVYSEFMQWNWELDQNVKEVLPTFRAYRHWDGYPEAHGLDIVKALAMADEHDQLDNRSWEQHFLKRYLSMDFNVNVEPPAGDGQWCHGDLEYVYRLTGKQDHTGGREPEDGFMAAKVLLEVFEVYGVELNNDYSGLDGCEPVFSGSWREFPKWLAWKFN